MMKIADGVLNFISELGDVCDRSVSLTGDCYNCTGVPDQMVDAVTLLRDRAESEEANVLYSLVNDLSKVCH